MGVRPVSKSRLAFTIADNLPRQVGAQKGYEHANGTALELWEKTYPNALLIALTDTFSTEAFYKVWSRTL